MVALRKLQEFCCYEPADDSKAGAEEDFDEGDFNNEICRCLLRVLPVRKGEPVADRIIRFTTLFLKHATDSGMCYSRRYLGRYADVLDRQCYIPRSGGSCAS